MSSNPMTAAHFRVEVSGFDLQAGFSEVSGLDVEVATVAYRSGSDPRGVARRIPGLTTYADVVLGRGMVDLELFTWMELSRRHSEDARRDVVITLLDPGDMSQRASWSLQDCWPIGLFGPVLRADITSVAVERLVLAHAGYTVQIG